MKRGVDGMARLEKGEAPPRGLHVPQEPLGLQSPMSLMVWTTKSTRNLAASLTQSGHRVSDRTVAKMLRDLGFGLQANAKMTEGRRACARWPTGDLR